MVRLLIFTILLIASSCKNEKESEPGIDYTGFSDKEIVLAGVARHSDDPDTIGNLFIKIPARLDTFYQWFDQSDCRSCGSFLYRFSDTRYKQFAEGGMFWTYTPDSVYQFTMSHEPSWEGPDSISNKHLTIKETPRYEHLSYKLASTWTDTYLKKEFREIDGRGFVIAGFMAPQGRMTNDTTVYLTAMTRLKKRTLYFNAECGAKDTAGFIASMYKSLLSIRIEEK